MINSFKNPAIMRILRTTERHGAGWREQNFIPHHEAPRLNPLVQAVSGKKEQALPTRSTPGIPPKDNPLLQA